MRRLVNALVGGVIGIIEGVIYQLTIKQFFININKTCVDQNEIIQSLCNIFGKMFGPTVGLVLLFFAILPLVVWLARAPADESNDGLDWLIVIVTWIIGLFFLLI